LLSLMAKARIPGYNPENVHQHNHMVNVQVMPRASTYEEWRDQRERELTPDVQTIEGSFKELPAPAPAVGTNQNDNAYRPAPTGLRDVL